MKHLYSFFQPRSLIDRCKTLQPYSLVCAVLFFALGCYNAWFVSPIDYQHGPLIRILYVHVPASWMALFIFGLMGVMAAVGLLGSMPTAYRILKVLTPVGLIFATISLITGSLWGRPAWGTWWVWDARLTSMALLWVQYWGCFALQRGYRDPWRGDYVTGVFVLIGLLNLPIIKWSVTWWNTLHQPASLMKWGAPTIHTSFLWPLGFMALGCLTFTLWMITKTLPFELSQQKQRAAIK